MTIKRGEQWGRPSVVPSSFLTFSSDSDLARSTQAGPSAVSAGDLWLALGRPGRVLAGAPTTEVDVDALEVTISRDHGVVETLLAASSVEIGRWRAARGYLAVLNTGFCRGLNLTPRSHPNDGRFEVFTLAALTPLVQRVLIRRRARSGAHLPHPSVSVSVTDTIRVDNAERARPLRIDGRDAGAWTSLSVTCLPDHWRVLV